LIFKLIYGLPLRARAGMRVHFERGRHVRVAELRLRHAERRPLLLIRFTDRVVVDFYAPGESTHARQLLPCAELPCCYQKHDLFCELLLQRNVAVLADLPRPRANVASDHPGNRRTSRLATTYKVPVK